MSDKRFIEFELIQSGQPRPYADHIYEGYITFTVPEGQLWASKFPSDPENVKPWVRLLLHNWMDEPAWHEPRLVLLERVSEEPNKWHAIVSSPYLD